MSKKMAKRLHEEFKMACFVTTFLLSLCVANNSQAANSYDVCNKYTDKQFRDCKDQVRQQEQQQAKQRQQQAEARRQQQAQQRAQQEQEQQQRAQEQAQEKAQQEQEQQQCAQEQAQEKAQQMARSLQESQQMAQALEKAKSQLDVLQKDLAQKQAQQRAQQEQQQRQQQAEAQKSQQQKNNLNIQGNANLTGVNKLIQPSGQHGAATASSSSVINFVNNTPKYFVPKDMPDQNYLKGQCVAWATKVFSQASSKQLSYTGNAGAIATNAKVQGFDVVKDIKLATPGSMIVWKNTDGYGHVAAIVSNNEATQEVVISEANWATLDVNAVSEKYGIHEEKSFNYEQLNKRGSYVFDGIVLPK